MVDWKGLLNWSVKVQEEEKNLSNENKPEFKPMSDEDFKFLESAFESVCVNEMKEIMKILDKLKIPENEDIEERLNMLEDLLTLIDGLENGRNIVRAKRFHELIEYFFDTKEKKIKLSLANIFTSMLQNDKFVQDAAIELGLFKRVMILLNETQDSDIMDKSIYMLTGLLYGEYDKPKILFLNEYDGIKLLYNLLIKNHQHKKNTRRIMNILNEITRREDHDNINYKTRFIAMERIKEIKMNELLLGILEECDLLEFDIGNLVLEIFINIIKIYDNLEEIFKSLEKLNKKIIDSKDKLTSEEFKERQRILINAIKCIKDEFTKQDPDITAKDSNYEMLNDKMAIVKLKDD
jgi:hypothetical protein